MTAAQLYAAVSGRIPADPPPVAGYDEIVYTAQADATRTEGIGALRRLAQRFVDRPDLHCFPAPTRWLWLLLVALFRRVSHRALPLLSLLMAPLAAAYAFADILTEYTIAYAAVALCLVSPLLHIVGRRALQDGPVAAVTLLAIGAGLHGSLLGVAVLVFALLSLKEGAAFSLPAVAAACLYGAPVALLGVAIGIAVWVASLALLYGPRLAWRVLRASSRGHDNPYARAHQRGAPHRLLTDLLLLSPLPFLLLPTGIATGAEAVVVALLIGAHALAPVRNARFIVAADLAVRCIAAAGVAAIEPLLILPMLAADIAISLRMRRVYDPVTAELCAALGMPARS